VRPTTSVRSAVAVVVVSLLVAGLSLAALTSCEAVDEPLPPAAAGAAAPTLTGELTRYRRDEALRRLQVKLGQPAGEEPVVVSALRLSVPGYGDGPPSELDTQSRPGAVVDLPVGLGEPVCPGAGEPATEDAVPSGEPVAVATLDGPDGPQEVRIALTDPDGVGPQTWSRECSTLAALAAAPLELGRTWVRGGSPGALTASGELVVGPVAPGREVEVVEVVGTTLFSAAAAAAVPLPLRVAGGGVAALPLVLAPARCDPHAVGESKRGYAFGVRVVVDGGEPVLVTVEPVEAARVQLEDVLLEQCGLA
jgi:hypothetical protein